MNEQNKTKEELIKELQELQQEHNSLKTSYDKYISQSKQAQEALHSSEENYKELIDGMNETVWVIDFKGNVIDVNNTAIEVLGYSKEELLTIGLFGIDTSLKKEDIKALAKAMLSDKVQIFVTSHKTKNGKIFPVEVQSSLVTYQGKQAILSIVRDITAHKQAEVALRESEEKFRKIIETSPDGIAITTLDGTMQFVTAKVVSMWGYTLADEIIGRNTMEFVHPSYHEKAIFLVNEMINGKLTGASDYLMVRKDGSHFYAEANANILCDANNKPIGILYVQRDITHRKQAEIALQESEHKLRTIFNAMKDVVFEMDYDGRYIYIAPTSDNLMVKPPKEVVGKTLYEVFPKPEADIYLEFVRKCLDENKMNTIEYPVLINDKTIWFEGRAVPKTKNSVLFIASDITERKLAEEALRESEEKYRLIFEYSPLGLLSFNENGVIDACNDNFAKIIGAPQKELAGLNMTKLSDKKLVASIQKALDGGSGLYEDVYHSVNSEKITPVRVLFAPIDTGENRKQGGVGIIEDITERIEAEKKLKESEAIKNTMVSNIGDVIVIIDQNGINQYKSPNITKLFGWQPDELVGKSTFDNVHPDDLISTQKFVDAIAMIPGTKGAVEIRYKCKDGSYVWIEITMINLFGDPNINGLLGNYHDITERRQVEQELILSKEKAETSDRLKTAFINNISHEIRTPLNGILGFAQLIIQPDTSLEEKQTYLNILNHSSDRLMNTVTSYIDIALIASGNMEVHFEQVELSAIMHKVYEHFQKQGLAKNLELKMNLPENENQFILNTDKELVRKIISHIFDNAIKFTNTGSIELGYVLKNEGENPEIEIFIKDTGQGISKDANKLVFRNFRQENIDNTRGHEGSGLGLSIAKGLTEILSGEMRLESELNKGTTVFVKFPVETTMLSDQKEMNLTKNRKGKFGTVLIAEDDEMNYVYIETMLKGSFAKILKAENGQEAVDLCHQHPEMDLVLMDIKMPVMGGIEATRQIKSFRKDLPIIVVTAFAQAGDERRFKEGGCDDYISKPFKKEELLGLIGKYII